MKFHFLYFLSILCTVATAQSVPVAVARLQQPGSQVSVRGIVTNGDELGKIRYLQDGTGGIAAFPGTGSVPGFEGVVQPGDSIQVSGTLVDYQGLLEINPVTGFQIISSGNPLPAPKQVAISGIDESLEGQLVQLSCISFSGSPGTFPGSGTYTFTNSEGESAMIYLRNGSPVIGTPVPASTVHLTAILSQYNSDYQLLPRFTTDFQPATCFFFIQNPEVSELQQTGFKVSWSTNFPATFSVKYGPTPALGTTQSVPGTNTIGNAVLNGLQPGAIYWVQIEAEKNGEVVLSQSRPFATVSQSSGEIKVFFNHSIDPGVLAGEPPPHGQSFDAVLLETITRINLAQQTIDVAMYNNNRIDLTNALKLAHANGKRVRYIASDDTANDALQPAPAFPVLYGNDSGLMHNKFLVIDADLTDKAWVMSGSLNWTSGNMIDDYNNTLFIQDQSLAKTYELEFNEMWGSSGPQPNESESRFGSNKADNTPHYFVIGNRNVESWFSPSDPTEANIVESIQSADNLLAFAIFSFTSNAIGDAIIDRYTLGAETPGIIENIYDPGEEYSYLSDLGIPVLPHPPSPLMHHKYAVADAGHPSDDPQVATGSHNWTYSAENSNDENTLIIHDPLIALWYYAEFQKRYAELTINTTETNSGGWEISPNPATGYLHLHTSNTAGPVRTEVFDLSGRLLQRRNWTGSTDIRLEINDNCRPGLFMLKITDSNGVSAVPFQVIQH